MGVRLDFYSISAILLDNQREKVSVKNDYYRKLFYYAFEQMDIIIMEQDDTIISRTLSGERSVIRDIIDVYDAPENFQYLQCGVADILKDVPDHGHVRKELDDLIWMDRSVSDDQKKKLTGETSLEKLITQCLLFSFRRKFIPRGKGRGDDAKVKKFDVSDYIHDYHYPKENRVFLGRERELKEIHEQLNQEHCLFLQGIGGIGKSELVKQYGKWFKKDYGLVIYLHYAGSLQQTLRDMDFVDDMSGMSEEELFQKHYRFFQGLNEDVLVILDNFDSVPEQDELFHDFLSLDFQLLATTRNVIDDVPCYLVKEIESIEALRELFYTYAPKGKAEQSMVDGILEEVFRHTLTVEMAAKTMAAADLTAEALCAALRDEGLNLANPNKVRVTKDSRTKKERLYGHIVTLFQLQSLSEEQRFHLRHMLLMPRAGIGKGLFHRWLDTSDFNATNELIEYGWIQEDELTCRISIHPFLHEVIAGFDQPSFGKCREFIHRLGNEYIASVEDEINFADLINLTKSIFRSIQVDDTMVAFQLITKVCHYLESYVFYNTMRGMLDIMKEIIPLDEDHKIEMAVYQFYQGVIDGGKDDWDAAKEHFDCAVEYLEPVNEETAELAIDFYSNLYMNYFSRGDLEKYQKYVDRAVTLREEYGFTDFFAYKHDKMQQSLAFQMKHRGDEAPDFKTILNQPQVKSFFDTFEELGGFSFSEEEFQSDVEKIQPDELLNEDKKSIYQDVKEEMEKIVPNEEKGGV